MHIPLSRPLTGTMFESSAVASMFVLAKDMKCSSPHLYDGYIVWTRRSPCTQGCVISGVKSVWPFSLWTADLGLLDVSGCTGARSSSAALSFASAPLFHAPRQRIQEKLQRSRQHFSAAHARWRQHSQALKQGGWPELQRCGGQAQPSLGPAAATMQYIRHARQAYQLVPAVAMC